MIKRVYNIQRGDKIYFSTQYPGTAVPGYRYQQVLNLVRYQAKKVSHTRGTTAVLNLVLQQLQIQKILWVSQQGLQLCVHSCTKFSRYQYQVRVPCHVGSYLGTAVPVSDVLNLRALARQGSSIQELQNWLVPTVLVLTGTGIYQYWYLRVVFFRVFWVFYKIGWYRPHRYFRVPGTSGQFFFRVFFFFRE